MLLQERYRFITTEIFFSENRATDSADGNPVAALRAMVRSSDVPNGGFDAVLHSDPESAWLAFLQLHASYLALPALYHRHLAKEAR